MDHNVQDRERAVQAITRRNMLEQRIKRTQRRMAALQGEARQALEDSLLADQAALSEAVQTMEEVKASMRQEEERIRQETLGRIRRKTQEALRLKAEWQAVSSRSFRVATFHQAQVKRSASS